jgi:tripeptidyl-peptidase-1
LLLHARDDCADIGLSLSAYQNVDQLETLLKAASTPGQSKYGKYLDVDGMNQIFAPPSDAVSSVRQWLEKSGATINSAADGVISFTSTVGKANALLDTKFAVYAKDNDLRLRTQSYSVPDSLAEHIDVITPTVYFGNIKPQRSHIGIPLESLEKFRLQHEDQDELTKRATIDPSCTYTYVSPRSGRKYTLLGPKCFQQLYNTVGYQADPKSGSTVAFSNFLNQSASYSDLALFEKTFGLPSQNFTNLALINGGVDNQDPLTEADGEANLDVQNLIGIVDGLPVYSYITGGSPPFQPDLLSPTAADNTNEPYLEFYQYLLSQPNSKLPYVITNSYGDHENTVPERYARRVCNQIGMMGLRGRTILESSGDEGVGAVCRNNQAPFNPEFTPQFPGTCPYITAVGGTQFLDPVEAWNASSGGFSRYFKQPWYQKLAVAEYLNFHITPATKQYYTSNNYTDFSGRGFPDVSAHSLYPYYATAINGTIQANGGTSAASPIVAGILTLLNDARFRAGQPSLGFINPLLYAAAALKSPGLVDVTRGAALGCQGVDLQNGIIVKGAGIIPYATWNATVGWDPVTGLGTLDFMRLKDFALLAGAVQGVIAGLTGLFF